MKQTHPNRRNFEGVLTRLDQPSDAAPTGSRGHRVILTTAAAEEALDSLEGMPVGFGPCWGVHNMRQRCGIITEGVIVGDELRVCGYLFDKDFPEVAKMIAQGRLGMSYELDNAHIADQREANWTITKLTFVGAAILFAEKAAYKTTRISLSAGASGEEHHVELPGEIVLRSVVQG